MMLSSSQVARVGRTRRRDALPLENAMYAAFCKSTLPLGLRGEPVPDLSASRKPLKNGITDDAMSGSHTGNILEMLLLAYQLESLRTTS